MHNSAMSMSPETPRDHYCSPAAATIESPATPLNIRNAASTLLFALNKATVKMKHNLVRKRYRNYGVVTPFSRRTRLRNRNENNDLSCEISSVQSPFLLRSPVSAPALLTRLDTGCSPYKFTELPDKIIVRIAKHLDGRSLLNLSQSCRRLRNLINDNESVLPRYPCTNYEVVICQNRESCEVDVRLLRRNRTLSAPMWVSQSIVDVVQKHMTLVGRVIFKSGVNVFAWKERVLEAVALKLLIPTALIFIDGNFSSAHHLKGADLRGFTEKSFLVFLERFAPHLQEVELLTTRLFKCSTTTPLLLNFAFTLRVFGLAFERPAIRFRFQDVRKIVVRWRADPFARNSTIYLRRLAGGNLQEWIHEDLEGDCILSSDNRLSQVIIRHLTQESVLLVFHFH